MIADKYFENWRDSQVGIPNWCTENECRLPEVRTEIVLTNGVLTRQAWWVVTYKDVKSTKGMNEWIFFLDGRQEEAAQVQRFKICIWSTFLGLNCDFWKTTSSQIWRQLPRQSLRGAKNRIGLLFCRLSSLSWNVNIKHIKAFYKRAAETPVCVGG